MELVHHEIRCKASKVSLHEGEDIISSLPENVITNIMNRLPLRDAVETSILSTSWRFKWTLLTQLIFDEYFFHSLDGHTHFDETNINRLLLHLKGDITKFVLHIIDWIELDDEDIHHWVMFLSRIRGFKELTLLSWHEPPVKLPTHLFSCLELKHLELYKCVLSPLPYFHGFPNLLSLDFSDVSIQDHRCGELIAQCPLLETVSIYTRELVRGELTLVEIAKLKNVKKLTLSMCLLDNMTMVRLSSVFHHMSLLPKLQKLCLSFEMCKFMQDDVAQNPVSTTFPFLKTLELCKMDFSSHSMLSCTFGMLFGCANLQTFYITATYKNVVPLPAIFSPEIDCSTMGQLQLQNVKIASIKGLENEVCLIKYMLACSPMLKSIVITASIEGNDGSEKYKLASKLLKLHRASPMAEIIF